jgi:hypothetical protein
VTYWSFHPIHGDEVSAVFPVRSTRHASPANADRRLPKTSEPQELVDYGQGTPPMIDRVFHAGGCGGTCMDLSNPACSCAQSDRYWSASAYVPQPAYGWTVAFGTGGVLSVGSSVSMNARHGADYVRAVRGGL